MISLAAERTGMLDPVVRFNLCAIVAVSFPSVCSTGMVVQQVVAKV